MCKKIIHPTHPDSMSAADNQTLRDRHLIGGL
jgi:hypothetical protein